MEPAIVLSLSKSLQDLEVKCPKFLRSVVFEDSQEEEEKEEEE